ncbi:hypothetical protein CA13_70700 [Planctomycetes bacterium CA13]|uniref:Uncharacterized protein n=1 Tax=Novipirellula herctigrandis TaxID=2527986 RepID=A0A5C5YNX3_9BACT|nr:hypothetical protein CA13_70700 [Planctomycetes bacterium CA13]
MVDFRSCVNLVEGVAWWEAAGGRLSVCSFRVPVFECQFSSASFRGSRCLWHQDRGFGASTVFA